MFKSAKGEKVYEIQGSLIKAKNRKEALKRLMKSKREKSKMTSQWKKEFCDTYIIIGNVRRHTKDILSDGQELAFKERYELNSYKRLKEKILNSS